MGVQNSSAIIVGLVQMKVLGSRQATLEVCREKIREASAAGARLICLQELFADPYFCQAQDPALVALAEAADGPLMRTCQAWAREFSVTLVAPFFERRAAGLYHNSLIVWGPDGENLGLYRKMHIPDDPQFMEKFYFTPGDQGFRTIESPVGRLGPLICWDQWFPEAARLTAMLGASVLLYPTAIGWLPSEKQTEGEAQLDAWRTILRSHAIANGVFVLAVNRVGQEGSRESGIEFWGHSLVIDPMGRILAEGGQEEQVLVVELDLSRIEETRKWWPFFRDRRIDAYGKLVERWSAD
jgi:N-carbamoylputrescine amidase